MQIITRTDAQRESKQRRHRNKRLSNLSKNCKRNVPYGSYKHARSRLVDIMPFLPVTERQALHVYECPICGTFHIVKNSRVLRNIRNNPK